MRQQHIDQHIHSSIVPDKPFVRDRFTWFIYVIMGYLVYLQAMPGPLTSLLRGPLHLSYLEVGLPTGAYALGIILVGACGERLIRPWRNHLLRLIWLGSGGLVLGAILLVLSQNISMVIVSALILGISGSLVQFLIQAALAEHHGETRAVALTEANAMASAGAVLAPLLIGGCEAAGLSWRTAVLCAPVVILCALLHFRTVKMPVEQVSTRVQTRPASDFPLAFWLYALVLICCIAIEWSLIVWSAITLQSAGLDRGVATILVSLFFIAELCGRLLGSRLARRASGTSLLTSALLVTGGGFLLFWLSPQVDWKIVGLLLTGLGVANLYPLTLAIALGTVPQRMEAASARLALGGGLAIFSAPLLLGWLAGTLGIQQAYGLVIGLLGIAGVLMQCANRLALHQTARHEVQSEMHLQES